MASLESWPPLPWILDTPRAAYGNYTCRDTDAPSTPTTCPSFPQSLLLVLKFRSCSVAVLFPWGVSDSFSIQEKSLRRDPAPNPWIREGRVRVRGARHVCGWCLIITKATRKWSGQVMQVLVLKTVQVPVALCKFSSHRRGFHSRFGSLWGDFR